MFIKKTVCILMFISCSIFGFSQNDISFYDEFIRINNILGTQQYVSLQKMLVAEDNKFVDEKSAITIFSGESQVTSLSGTYFLSTPQGYWILNGKLKSPLKISGNFQIDEMEIQDILRIDYEKNYKKAVDDNEQGLLLERVSKKNGIPVCLPKRKIIKTNGIPVCLPKRKIIKTI
ncbi:hypothetical protein [Treponema brennaborense]|uniref:hypothetical protein n=1 Tax=Treponema brennaborense TaxID=81028 RepID=UPI0005A22975|nr:hypothetical protein [Treponema brennaborense]